MDIRPPPREWISMEITNALGGGTIVIRNPSLNSGMFLNDYLSREHYHSTVDNCQIYPNMLQVISACASEGYRGTSGTITLYEGSTSICTLRWDCPGRGRLNSLQAYNEDGNYLISIGAFNASGAFCVDITIHRA